MAGLRGFDRDRHRLQVPHLADQHNVGVFTQRCPQRDLEALGVQTDFPLVDQALLVRMHELDGVLDGHDVLAPVLVDVVDHRRQRRGLARAGRAGDQHQAPGQPAQVDDFLREAQIVDRANVRRYDAKYASHSLAIQEQVAAVTSHAADLIGEIAVVKPLELLPFVLRRDGEEHVSRRFRRQRTRVGRHDLAVLAKHG